MSTNAELARAKAFREKYAKAVANGVTFISPMFMKAFHGRRMGPGTVMSPETFGVQKGIEWDQGGGTGSADFSWLIEKEIPTGEANRGELRQRSFEQPSPLDKATVLLYQFERTAAISDGDIDRTKNDDTMLDDLWKRRSIGAQNAIWTMFRKLMWNTSETAQNGGLSHICKPGNVAAGTYAGIAMAATNPYWTPQMNQYTGLTIAANGFEVLTGLKVKLTRSEEAGGGGMQLEPDFACFNPTSWLQMMVYVASKYSMHDQGALRSPNMFAKGIQNFWVNGLDCFYDNYFGGTATLASQYLESAAAEEFVMGHSDKIFLSTTASKSQGLVRSEVLRKPVVISGTVGVFRTGLFCLRFESPCFFGYAYL
ncbi:MAG TPA: hypothetical protein VMW52_08180 [Phycisphaerae bacterium]|nr:hypothetical protein [Phycisphaerae bacterium]